MCRIDAERAVQRTLTKYGKNKISLAKRTARPGGWQDVECVLYGRTVIKTVKTFLATHPTFGGAVRVVIVREHNAAEFFYCTDTSASVVEILESYADRGTIEQVFHDVKEVWGGGQQQVRNLWAVIARAKPAAEVAGSNRPGRVA